ncbi:unnamed protein product [Heligmosomoides polygyrus]|uniref:Hepatocyte growth factor-regulated tyrosine kinase substrate n=1 Tax=Heligmosomoides polygyrus TaxID=6339 RepID=A0A183F6D8_HELPZ|nr:unnamed protein product [Heligmosomoides polygyrus]
MEEFKNLGIGSQYEDVKTKVLEMLQCWAMAFANKPEYKIVVDTHNLMKLAGFDFPSIKEADAMFTAQVAPDWHDGSECFRCRSEFSLFNRKHHCRACGQIFCDRCSTKEIPLPQFGIEKEVRVCDACYEKIIVRVFLFLFFALFSISVHQIKAEISQAEKEKLLKEKEEEDLALALAISQSEAEAKVRMPLYVCILPYLNRDYWQQRKAGVEEWAGASASAPLPSESSITPTNTVVPAPVEAELAQLTLRQSAAVNDDMKSQTEGTLKWCQQLKEQVTVMENRIRSNNARGRSVLNDTAIQGLFTTLTEFHSQVLGALTKLDQERTYYESLQDHLGHISEARLAINELRAEHCRRQQERLAEEQRQRQAQMKQTLEMMRMKKHVMLMEQRNVALQRFQHQEMQARRGQGYAQQQFAQPHPGYQQYPNAAVPTSNQWSDPTIQGSASYPNPAAQQQQQPSFTSATTQSFQQPQGHAQAYYVSGPAAPPAYQQVSLLVLRIISFRCH